MITLLAGRIRTCLLPLRSALVIVLRASARTEVRTILGRKASQNRYNRFRSKSLYRWCQPKEYLNIYAVTHLGIVRGSIVQ